MRASFSKSKVDPLVLLAKGVVPESPCKNWRFICRSCDISTDALRGSHESFMRDSREAAVADMDLGIIVIIEEVPICLCKSGEKGGVNTEGEAVLVIGALSLRATKASSMANCLARFMAYTDFGRAASAIWSAELPFCCSRKTVCTCCARSEDTSGLRKHSNPRRQYAGPKRPVSPPTARRNRIVVARSRMNCSKSRGCKLTRRKYCQSSVLLFNEPRAFLDLKKWDLHCTRAVLVGHLRGSDPNR